MNFLLNIFSGSYEELWKAIIRPYKDEYTNKDLGPEKFRLNSKYYKRTDFSLKNSRKQLLMCSFWEPYDEEREYSRLPCVIYLHGNSSSRCEVVPNLKYLLPLNICVFSFDFAACGHSEGEYISLGWYETLDVKSVINYLRNTNKVGPIGIWGRSMGAVTGIMYGYKDPSIGGLFLDSPFFSLNLLMDELSKEKVSLPGFLVKQVLIKIKETVKEKAGFNIDDINTENFCKKCFVPAFFCHGKDDTFVRVHHCNDLYKIYPGEKDILIVEGDHNDIRPNELNEKAAEFFYHALKCKYIKEMNEYYLGFKFYIKDWYEPKFRTPTGNEEDDAIIFNDINNNFFEIKNYSETIPIKDEPDNNYSKKKFVIRTSENNNLKFNNKLKKNKTTNQNLKLQEQDKYQDNNKVSENKKLTKSTGGVVRKKLLQNNSKDIISNVNFNNYKKVQVNATHLFPKDSFRYNKNANDYIKPKKAQQNLVLKTEINNNNYKDKMYREIIKINYQNKPMYNYTNNRLNNNRNNYSVNKYRINNNLIQLNNTTTLNKKRNFITNMPSQPNFKIQNVKGINYNYNDFSFLNNSLDKIIPGNNYTEQKKPEQNRNNYYNINNNNIYINQFQNIYY